MQYWGLCKSKTFILGDMSDIRYIANKGKLNWNSRLTEDQVREIITSDKSGVQLAIDHDVSQATIYSLRCKERRIWKHIDV